MMETSHGSLVSRGLLASELGLPGWSIYMVLTGQECIHSQWQAAGFILLCWGQGILSGTCIIIGKDLETSKPFQQGSHWVFTHSARDPVLYSEELELGFPFLRSWVGFVIVLPEMCPKCCSWKVWYNFGEQYRYQRTQVLPFYSRA